MDTKKLPSRFINQLNHLSEEAIGKNSAEIDGRFLNHLDNCWKIILMDNFFRTDLSQTPAEIKIKSQKNKLEIEIDKDCNLKKPVVFYFFTSEKSRQHILKTTVNIKVNACSSLSILEKHIHLGEVKDNYGINCSNNFLVEQNSELQFIRYWQGGEGSLLLTDLTAELKRDARLHSFTLTEGGNLTHHQILVNMPQKGADTQVHGLYNLNKNQHAEHFSKMNHLKDHTYSNQLFKGILQDESVGMYTGDIKIHPQAREVEANQLNRNLLMGKKAHALARPELNIEMDDVKCSHGVTVGQLMEEENFYLQARGIKEDRAQKLLLSAFARDVLLKIPHKDIRRHLFLNMENPC
ncbi:MAG: Fe-S cluster assembly protein SufD [Halobacteriovoraceae bacterium]|nr:Fe-S cluster assembly protein SufD [Halobacteriovoraceae bacterium]